MPFDALAQFEGQRRAVLAPRPFDSEIGHDRIEPVLRDMLIEHHEVVEHRHHRPLGDDRRFLVDRHAGRAVAMRYLEDAAGLLRNSRRRQCNERHRCQCGGTSARVCLPFEPHCRSPLCTPLPMRTRRSILDTREGRLKWGGRRVQTLETILLPTRRPVEAEPRAVARAADKPGKIESEDPHVKLLDLFWGLNRIRVVPRRSSSGGKIGQGWNSDQRFAAAANALGGVKGRAPQQRARIGR